MEARVSFEVLEKEPGLLFVFLLGTSLMASLGKCLGSIEVGNFTKDQGLKEYM